MRKIVKIVLCVLAVSAIATVGIIFYKESLHAQLVRSVEDARTATAEEYDRVLPIYTGKRYAWIKEVQCVTELEDKPQHPSESKQDKSQYYDWNDCITLTYTADDSFDSLPSSTKLSAFMDLRKLACEKAEQLVCSTSEIYNEYFHKTTIEGIRGKGIFPHRYVAVYIKTGSNVYDYMRESWCEESSFRKNGVVVISARKMEEKQAEQKANARKNEDMRDYSHIYKRSNSSYSTNSTKSSYSAGSKSSKSKSSRKTYDYYDYMPDCDDYEDWEEFMDDWDGNMPDGSDASDYWDEW